MYALIPEAKENIQGYSLSGTVGSVPFSQKNVVGNFTVSNKGTNPSTFNLGNASIGQLTGTLHGLNINRNQWKGLYITPTVQIGQTAVPFPSKRYRIDQAEHINGMVKFTAYDDMERFEAEAGVTTGSSGTPYELLALACQSCNVELGMTQSEVEALPNGIQPLAIDDLGDIETWRDLLYWIGVTLCSFSFINREGKLALKHFHKETDDTMPVNVRYDGATYSDEIITYTGAYVTVTAEEAVRYYAAAEDTGYSLIIGANPFMQGAEAYRQILAENIVEGLGDIEYIAGNIQIPFGFHYDLGDVLLLPGGNGSATNKFCILGYEFTYNGKCRLTGIPGSKKSMSKTDKNIQGLLNTVDKNEFRDYEQKNAGIIEIGDGEEERICSVKLASNNNTKALIHIQVNLEAEADEIADILDVDIQEEEEEITATASGDDIFRLVSGGTTKGIVRYLINSEEVEMKPEEQWLDGKHILHLMYVQPLESGIPVQFDAYLKAEGGTIKIPRGGLWLYGSGRGLVGDGKWDGTFNIQEDAADFSLIEIGIEQAIEGLIIDAQTPTAIIGSDTAAEFTLQELTFENAADLVFVNLYVGKYDLITEAGETFTTEDGIALVTEHD